MWKETHHVVNNNKSTTSEKPILVEDSVVAPDFEGSSCPPWPPLLTHLQAAPNVYSELSSWESQQRLCELVNPVEVLPPWHLAPHQCSQGPRCGAAVNDAEWKNFQKTPCCLDPGELFTFQPQAQSKYNHTRTLGNDTIPAAVVV